MPVQIDETDPISLEPISELPYPPFSLALKQTNLVASAEAAGIKGGSHATAEGMGTCKIRLPVCDLCHCNLLTPRVPAIKPVPL